MMLLNKNKKNQLTDQNTIIFILFTVGPITPNLTDTSYKDLESRFTWLQIGGHHTPTGCKPREQVAVLIPFRNRGSHLRILLNNLHPILYRQQLGYTIYVLKQVSKKHVIFKIK